MLPGGSVFPTYRYNPAFWNHGLKPKGRELPRMPYSIHPPIVIQNAKRRRQ